MVERISEERVEYLQQNYTKEELEKASTAIQILLDLELELSPEEHDDIEEAIKRSN